MKWLVKFMCFGVILFYGMAVTPASAQLFGSDEKNWEKVLIELKKINARLVSMNNNDLPNLKGNQADMMQQVNGLRNMLPSIQGKMEELNTNQGDQLATMQARIGQIETFVQAELTRQAELQKGELAGFKGDVAAKFDELRQGMAKDMEQFATSNQTQFQELSKSNDATLSAIKLQLDKQADMTGRVIQHMTKILEVSTRQSDTMTARLDVIQQTFATNQQALATGFAAIEANNRVINKNTETITQVLKSGFTEQEKVQQVVIGMGQAFSKTEDNIKLTRESIGALKDILDPKLDSLVQGQTTLQTNQGQVSKIAEGVGAIQAGQVQTTERFNKLVESTQAMVKHSSEVNSRLGIISGSMESGQGNMGNANQKLTKLIEILKVMAKEQTKFDDLISGQGQLRNVVAEDQQKLNQLVQGQNEIKTIAGGGQEKLSLLVKQQGENGESGESNPQKLDQLVHGQNQIQAMIRSDHEKLELLTTHQAKVGKVVEEDQQKLDQLVHGQGQLRAAVAGSSQKLDQLGNGQNEVRQAVIDSSAKTGQILSTNMEVGKVVTGVDSRIGQMLEANKKVNEALADLRRKANVNIGRNDDIVKRLKDLAPRG